MDQIAWRSFFELGALQRGQAYAVRERASLIALREESKGWLLEAKVRGTRSLPYTTEVSVTYAGRSEEVQSYCSCPMGGDCKHAVAVIESFVALNKTVRLPGKARSQTGEAPLPVPLRRWIDASIQGNTSRSRPPIPHPEVVRFSFGRATPEDVERGAIAQLQVLLFPVGARKLGQPLAINLRGIEAAEFPSCFEEEDVRLCREVVSLPPTPGSAPDRTISVNARVPNGRFWGLLVRDLLATGRVIWERDPGAVLERAARLHPVQRFGRSGGFAEHGSVVLHRSGFLHLGSGAVE